MLLGEKTQHSCENAAWLLESVAWQLGEGDNHFFGVSFDIESAMVIFFGE